MEIERILKSFIIMKRVKLKHFRLSDVAQHDVDIISDKDSFFHNAPNNPTSDIKIFNYETMKITKNSMTVLLSIC